MITVGFSEGTTVWTRQYKSVEDAVDDARRYIFGFCDYIVRLNGKQVCCALPVNYIFGQPEMLPF